MTVVVVVFVRSSLAVSHSSSCSRRGGVLLLAACSEQRVVGRWPLVESMFVCVDPPTQCSFSSTSIHPSIHPSFLPTKPPPYAALSTIVLLEPSRLPMVAIDLS
ncbi:hypothetical protein GSI_10985 [Ganoderma sinense ZZ0214-1]|uniref:Transporter n=1 Tax=Ganoderma sinense ZZ0214-1 TaxID=1077348 RepID=A0A2G8S250_9APHY|nr:hypothetical protein GSI_10985 [Ganoderma sinense ZZ0214-1]